jgi:hypothetical protein
MTSLGSDHSAARPRQILHQIGAHIANLLWRERGAERRHVAALCGDGLNRGREFYWRFLIVDDGFVADIVALITNLEDHVPAHSRGAPVDVEYYAATAASKTPRRFRLGDPISKSPRWWTAVWRLITGTSRCRMASAVEENTDERL